MILKKLTDFTLNAYYPYVPLLKYSRETSGKLESIFHDIPAKVPGSVHHDLLRAGIIKDPYFEMQSMDCEWVSQRWWIYKTYFDVEDYQAGRVLRLRLCGIDYKAFIVLNGKLLGTHEGMYVPFVANISQKVKKSKNCLEVILENPPEEMGQIGYTSCTYTQKARFTYKWDFCPRMVHVGLYDDVYLEDFGAASIEYAELVPVCENRDWRLDCGFDLSVFSQEEIHVRVTLTKDGVKLCEQETAILTGVGEYHTQISLPVANPELWYPLGHGAQPLYHLEAVVTDRHGISDRKDYRVGFRTLEYNCCEGASADSLPYSVSVNGKKIYIKGVNMTPLDMMYGAVSEERYREILIKARDANINMIRIWGGGLIESEAFYQICDELGILVWQEFIQSSSGIENIPSKRPEFLNLLRKTAEEATKTRRNHVCLTFWSGGNELTDQNDVPSGFDDPNLSMLLDIVQRNNPGIKMLPTSASGPQEFLNLDAPGRNHDVHGPWKYGGVTGHYTLFNQSDSQLHSEFGVDGYANYACLSSFLREENLICDSMRNNLILRHHGEWWDTYDRDSQLFGAFEKHELQEFIACSQFIQAEGIRYALESNRRRAFRNCGSILWQLNEPWPNASGTNILDYYLKPKLAYYFLRDAYRTTAPTLKYHKLIYHAGEVIECQAWIVNDGAGFQEKIEVIVESTDHKTVYHTVFEVDVTENGPSFCGNLHFEMPDADAVLVRLRMQVSRIESEYLLLRRGKDGLVSREPVIRYYQEKMLKEE